MASGLPTDLETLLEIVEADEQREAAAVAAAAVREGYEQLAAVDVVGEELQTSTETAQQVLRVAKSRRRSVSES